MVRKVEIMDTTLRDGEQTNGVSFSQENKKEIAQMLLYDLGVNRIEVASARVSNGEFASVKKLSQWADRSGGLSRLEVLGFVDNGASVDWIRTVGCRVMNLLCKGSLRHLTEQLRKTPEEHAADIEKQVQLAADARIEVNVYLEDWSNGIRESSDYVFQLTDALLRLPVRRIMLPDTLGILNPWETETHCRTMLERYPNVHFDFHAHNDYDLAVANVAAAIRAGVHGVHVTVNGLGERAGNAPLSSVVAVIHDQLGLETSIRETQISPASKRVEMYSFIRIAPNRPVIGEHVFTQCAGIHADGDSKDNLYCNALSPGRFGREREYALSKNSGRANIRKNLELLGFEDIEDDMISKVSKRLVEMGDTESFLTQDDLFLIVADEFENDTQENIKLLNYSLSLTKELKPVATLKVEIEGKAYEMTATGVGQYDAFVKAMREVYKQLGRDLPNLTDYTVSIPPGGETDALVRTVISWKYNDIEFKTLGREADQVTAAIKATIKMLNTASKLEKRNNTQE